MSRSMAGALAFVCPVTIEFFGQMRSNPTHDFPTGAFSAFFRGLCRLSPVPLGPAPAARPYVLGAIDLRSMGRHRALPLRTDDRSLASLAFFFAGRAEG